MRDNSWVNVLFHKSNMTPIYGKIRIYMSLNINKNRLIFLMTHQQNKIIKNYLIKLNKK